MAAAAAESRSTNDDNTGELSVASLLVNAAVVVAADRKCETGCC